MKKIDMILHKILTFFLILIQIITIGFCGCPVSNSTVKYVSACPKNKEEWERASLKKNCSSIPQNCTAAELFQYHCLLTPFLNSTVEVSAERRIINGYCAEYNFLGERVQDSYHMECYVWDPPCPTRYNSTDAYKYAECYKNASMVGTKEKTNTDREEKEKSDNETENKEQTDMNILIVALVPSIVAILFIGIASVIAYKYSLCSKYRGCRQQGTETRDISRTVRDPLSDDQESSVLIDKPEGPFSLPDKGCGNQRHSEHLDTDMGSEDNGCGNQRNSEHVDTEWGSEDTEEKCFFYETETYKTAYNMLQNQDILVFDGLSGTGKTFTAKHILHELKSRGFTPIKCQVPEDLTMCEEKSGKLILFVDDLFNCKSAERIQWLKKLDKFLNLLQKESCNESVCYKLIATVKTSLKEFMLERYSKHNFLHILEGNDGNHLVSFDVKLSKNEMKGILENTAKGLHCAVPNFSEEEWEHFEGCNFPFGFPLFAKLFMIPQKFSYEIFVSDPSAYLANEIKKAVENDKDMLPLFYLLTIQEFELTNRKRVQEIDLAHEDECTQLLSSYSSTLGEWSQNGTCLASKYVDYFFKFGKGESKFHFIHESVRDAVLKYLLTNFLKECVKEFPLDILCSEWDVCLSEKTHDVTISMQNIAERLISALMEKEDFFEISSFSIFTDKIFVDIFFQKLKDKKLYFLFTATDETNKCPLPYWFAFHGSTIILEKIIDIMTNEEGGMKGKESNTLFFILAGLCNSKCKHSIEWIENMLSNFCCEKILNICFHCFSKRYCDEHSYLLDLSCSNYNKDIVRFLLKRGAKFHKSTWNGWDFLRSAAAHRDDQFLLESFLQKVKKFKIENYNKNAKEKSPEEIIHEFHKEDSFLLDLATKCEPKIHLSKKTVQAVLSIAELNISDEPHNILSSCNDRNETILHVIVKSANNNGSTIEDAAELLEYLKNQNACQDVFDIDDNTPLMIELSKPDPNFKIIERLLSCTQNVNLSDIENRNLLHTFLMKPRTTKNDRLILELLIEKGVYSKHQDQNKKMPHDYALKNKCSTPIKCYLNRN